MIRFIRRLNGLQDMATDKALAPSATKKRNGRQKTKLERQPAFVPLRREATLPCTRRFSTGQKDPVVQIASKPNQKIDATRTIVLRNGTIATVKRLREEDRPKLIEFLTTAPHVSVSQRWAHSLMGKKAVEHEADEYEHYARADRSDCMVVETGGRIVAVAAISESDADRPIDPELLERAGITDPEAAVITMTVDPEQQGQGIGVELAKCLKCSAELQNYKAVVGEAYLGSHAQRMLEKGAGPDGVHIGNNLSRPWMLVKLRD